MQRKREDWDQAELAERANVSRPTVSKFENGQDIKLSTLFQMIRALGGRLETVVPSAESSPSPSGETDGNDSFDLDRSFGV